MGMIARQMSERELQDNVIAMARTLGWEPYHTHDSRRSQPGYPDLTLAHVEQGRLVFAELKTERGRLRPAQVVWLGILRSVARDRGLEVYEWRPSHWLSGEIERVLRGDA